MTYVDRLAALDSALRQLPDAVVAFSGGVDSSVLLHAARRVLGARTVGLIGDSAALPRRELAEARELAARMDVRLEVLATDEMERAEYRANDGRRCYFCRQTLFAAMKAWARQHEHSALLYGEIVDDRGQDRPGRIAAGEFAVRAPLAEAGFSKEDVRRYAREHGLPTAEKPAAACLASRLAPGMPVTRAGLARIEEAEERLREFHFGTLRVRDHGQRARIEVDAAALERARSLAPELRLRLEPLGFTTVELAAYRVPAAPSRPPPSGIQRPHANSPPR